MTGKGHLTIGIALSTATASLIPNISPEQAAGFVLVGGVASILPDIDANESLIKVATRGNYRPKIVDSLISKKERYSISGSIIYAILSGMEVAIRALLVLLMDLTHLLFGHRGVTHYLITSFGLFVIFLTISLIFGWSIIYSFAFLIGYTSHILGDACTSSGLAFLRPFTSKKIHILPEKFQIRMGKSMTKTEGAIVSFVLVICGLAVWVGNI